MAYNPLKDGACQFGAVAHQLTNSNVICTDATILHKNVVKHLTDNHDNFVNFVSDDSVASWDI